jgi:uncharacterized protein (TIGR02270 family)
VQGNHSVNAPLMRHLGLSPAETSGLINEQVVAQHAEEAAFLWTLRARATSQPNYSLRDLFALDERVEAHLDGLRLGGEVAWRYCNANLTIGEGPGEVFTMAVMAFGAGHRERMRDVLRAACASEALLPGLESGLGWLDYAAISAWVSRLLDAKSPAHRAVGIAACALHREDPGPALAAGIEDADSTLRARAIRAVGEIKRHDLLGAVLTHTRDEDAACRSWATWSVTLLGQKKHLGDLAESVKRNDPFSERALQLCVRAMPLPEGRRLISSLANEPSLAHFAIIGTAILGDPVSVPWLIRKMASPDSARLAGEAFTMITGADLEYLHLDQDAPPTTEASEGADVDAEVPESDYESKLPWPSSALVVDWWERNQQSFSPGVRYLAGRAIDRGSASEVLVHGKQRQRAAAAIELALMDPNLVPFNVRGRGSWQQRKLVEWKA